MGIDRREDNPFLYLRGNGLPDDSTHEERFVRLLTAQHEDDPKVMVPEGDVYLSGLREHLANLKTPESGEQ